MKSPNTHRPWSRCEKFWLASFAVVQLAGLWQYFGAWLLRPAVPDVQ
jgi:hypothetical protein